MIIKNFKLKIKNYPKGSIMLLVIVFGGIFFTMLAALSSFVLV